MSLSFVDDRSKLLTHPALFKGFLDFPALLILDIELQP